MKLKRLVENISRGLKKLEEFFLCALLVGMIVLACLQIVLRDFFSGGLLWADPLLRYMVLWSGMFGAAVATREGKHIALDVVSFLIPPRLKPWLKIVIHLFSSLVAMALTYAAFLFVRNEMEFGGIMLLSIPSWGWNLVFPMAFALISFRFLAAAWAEILFVAGLSDSSQAVNELPQ
ncbi:MAG: TRAP transporter small permease [Desulfobulbaceae bacterium]|nr:TRAP transporter small permease [Desulfobulbaceae bacterium]